MRWTVRALCAMALAATACARHGAARTPDILSTLDREAPASLARHGVPSIAVAYIREGRVAWTRVYGEQSAGVPATTRTLYNVASLTKPVFAELVLRLAARGRLSLDEPMASDWVDPDVAADPRHRLLTPRIALSHRTGFANWRRETGGVLRFQFDPGTKYQYSGEGYEYVSMFLQKRLRASLPELARQHLFVPLGMRNADLVKQEWFGDRVARPKGGEGQYGESSFSTSGNAADDLHTTIGDYAAFLAAVVRHEGLPTRFAALRDSIHVSDASAIEFCTSKKVARCPTRAGHGVGWAVMEYPDGKVVWHTGSDWGEKSMVFYFPERREGVVLLTNGANGFQSIIDVGTLLVPNRTFADYLRAGRN